MTLVQRHTMPYNAAASDLVVHVHRRQFFSAKRRERLGRGTDGVTGTTSRIGGGLTTVGTGFWCHCQTPNHRRRTMEAVAVLACLLVRVNDQGSGRQQKVFAVDSALGTTCHRLRHLHVLIVERARRPGPCCGQARGCVNRHGRLLVVLAQLLACGALSAAARFSWSNAL